MSADQGPEVGQGEIIARYERDLDRALAALWKIRMAAESAGVDDDPNVFTRHVLYLAQTGMPGGLRRRAQEAAHDHG